MNPALSRLARVSLFFNIAAAAVGCATDGSRSSDSSDSLRVALLTPGPISDQAWNSGAYEGLIRIRDSLGAKVSHIETKVPAEFEESFRQYGAQGYDVVFGHGYEFQDAAARVGAIYPRTIYVSTGGDRAAGNVVGMEFAFEEGSYLAGMIAGGTTRSNVVGCIGGTEMPPVKRSFDAFAAGVRAVNPQARVLTSYVGNWEDVSAGKEQALAQIGRGADVIFGNADAAGLGIFQAARESKSVRIIGANSDQAHVAPEVVIGSVVIDLPHAFLSLAREVQSGQFKSRVVRFDTKSDVVRWVYNPALRETVPAATRAQVDSVTGRIRAGTFSWSSGGPATVR